MDLGQGSNTDVSPDDERIKQLVREVVDLLDELIEAEVDSNIGWQFGPPPGDDVADRLAELVCRIRVRFATEEKTCVPRFEGEVQRLRDEHDRLLQQLDRVFALTGSPLRAAAIHFALATGIVTGFSTVMFAMDDKDDCEVTPLPTSQTPRTTIPAR